MAQTFFPKKSIAVEASPPHAPGTCYLVSIGYEMWEDGPEEVIKIQMQYSGKVSGRRSPSFPKNTDDFVRVAEAVEALESFSGV